MKLTKPTLLLTLILAVNTSFGLEAQKSKFSSSVKNESLNKKLPFDRDILSSDYSNWGLSEIEKGSINLLNAWYKHKKNSEVVVAVIDTGIDPEHVHLKENIYVYQGVKSTSNFGVDFSKKTKGNDPELKAPRDNHGHGTHVAGIIKTVFPEVKILALKYYNPEASGQQNLDSTIAALEYAVEAGVDVINYSGGGPEASPEELKVLKKAEKKGILIIAAAGNEKSNIDDSKNAYYPASYQLSNIITVMAHDQQLKRISSSNYGKKSVDISAPGYRIKSTIPGLKGNKNSDRSAYMTGTSQATAFVSGVAALIKAQYPNATPTEIKSIILAAAKKDSEDLKNTSASAGYLDAEQSIVIANAEFNKSSDKTRFIANSNEVKKKKKN